LNDGGTTPTAGDRVRRGFARRRRGRRNGSHTGRGSPFFPGSSQPPFELLDLGALPSVLTRLLSRFGEFPLPRQFRRSRVT
jgi:hypothetical protein